MVISTIIRTYKREHLLQRAVSSVLSQNMSCSDHEVIVVNDSGEPLSEATWQSDPRVRVITTNHTKLCVAGNTGVALSRGEYIHFLDDDDMILPEAYSALLLAAKSIQAVFMYGAYEGVDDEGKRLFINRPIIKGNVFALAVADARIPLGCALIKRDAFLQAGDLDSGMIPAEDAELLQRISLLGDIATTESLIARFRVGSQGATTTNWSLAAVAGHLKREKIFAELFCFPELKKSLRSQDNNPSLRGRLVRFYWGSAVRHMMTSPLTALSRFGMGCQLLIPGLLSKKVWKGLSGTW